MPTAMYWKLPLGILTRNVINHIDNKTTVHDEGFFPLSRDSGFSIVSGWRWCRLLTSMVAYVTILGDVICENCRTHLADKIFRLWYTGTTKMEGP